GASGLELATQLGDKLGRRKLADVTLIDKSRTHLWKPLLHEIAAGSMDFAVHEIDYLAQAHWHNFHYRIGEMIGLDRQRREVQLAAYIDEEGHEGTPQRTFRYDTLIIAVGSQSNDFGTPGVREHAISLDTPDQAKRFHGRLVNAYIRGHAQSQPLRPEQLRSQSSAQAPPARSWRRSCTTPRASLSPMALTGSIRRRTSRSISSKLPIASCRRFRTAFRT